MLASCESAAWLVSARCAASNGDEFRDRFKDSPIDLFLRFARGCEMSLRNEQGMIAAFHELEKCWRPHFRTDALQKIQRTKCIASALDEKDWRLQGSQNFVAQSRLITPAAKRVSKTNDSLHLFFE
jgi:hypothetical protein